MTKARFTEKFKDEAVKQEKPTTYIELLCVLN